MSATPQLPQEDDRVASGRVAALFVAGLLVAAAATWASSCLLGARRDALGRPRPAATQRAAPREIGMVDQTLIAQENRGADVRAAQARMLARWGWVDRDAGLARIPIERAMQLVIAREAATADGGAAP